MTGATADPRARQLSARERWCLAALVLLALVLRLIVLAQYQAHHPQAAQPVIDEASYDRWARAIAAGDWAGQGIFFQEPLYSYVLGAVYAIFGTSLTVARAMQAVLGAACTMLVFRLAQSLFDRRAAWIAAAAWACYRPALWFPVLLLKENLFVPLFAAFAIALLWTRKAEQKDGARSRRIAWCTVGFLGGLGALLRGNMLVLLPAFALWPIARAALERRPIRSALASCVACAIGAALALAPVCVRNQVVAGRFVLTTSGAGTNFYGGNNLDNPFGKATEFDWVRGIPEHEADDWRHEAERRSGRAMDATATSSFWMDAALASMREHPLEHAQILWNKLRLTLGAYEVPDNHFIEWDARYVALLALPIPGFALWGTLGLAGLVFALFSPKRWRTPGENRGAMLDVAALFTLYLGTIVLTVTSERARLPLVPLLLPFAGFAVLRAIDAVRTRSASGLALAACVALSALFVLTPAIPLDQRERDFDERDYNLAGGITRSDGDLEEAARLAVALDARYPGSARVALLRADIEYRRARAVLDRGKLTPEERERGRKGVENALALLKNVAEDAKPQESFRVHLLAGAIQQYLGQFEKAERHYRKALQFDPEDPDVRRRLAVSLANAAAQRAPGEERTKALREAEAILADLLRVTPDPDLEQLVQQIRAQLTPAPAGG